MLYNWEMWVKQNADVVLVLGRGNSYLRQPRMERKKTGWLFLEQKKLDTKSWSWCGGMTRIVSERSRRQMWHVGTSIGTARSTFPIPPHVMFLFLISGSGIYFMNEVSSSPYDGSCYNKCVNKVMGKHIKRSIRLCLGKRKHNLSYVLRITKKYS